MKGSIWDVGAHTGQGRGEGVQAGIGGQCYWINQGQGSHIDETDPVEMTVLLFVCCMRRSSGAIQTQRDMTNMQHLDHPC